MSAMTVTEKVVRAALGLGDPERNARGEVLWIARYRNPDSLATRLDRVWHKQFGTRRRPQLRWFEAVLWRLEASGEIERKVGESGEVYYRAVS